jgi:hypothetical protein
MIKQNSYSDIVRRLLEFNNGPFPDNVKNRPISTQRDEITASSKKFDS